MPLLLNAADLDRDGLDDAEEQALLEQFLPRFHLDRKECDVSPAEFLPGATPRPGERNGTIYGQAFPVERQREGQWVELHYHHLWARDCGRGGHDLDAEHVSALVSRTGGVWRAEYWYAAAHESTVCDVSMVRKAGVEARAEVWISSGKHASFLSKESCNRGGCGGDKCQETKVLHVKRLVNVGQKDAPMPGFEWVLSTQWPLAEKLDSDFHEYLLTSADANEGLVRASESVKGSQTTLAVGKKPVDAVDTAVRKTDGALEAGASETAGFLRKAARGVGRFLGKVR
ncbi:MAG: hypothetical protein IT163_03045 [Bryobacterales bacterium]|nr:hypothetical protein [Bryobacterales bacterium]